MIRFLSSLTAETTEKLGLALHWDHLTPTEIIKKDDTKKTIMIPLLVDAAETFLDDNTIDCRFSITVLEHISLRVIQNIFLKAKRIVKLTGSFIHFVDMSDHFKHTDSSITRINFMQYSESQ